MSAVSAPGAVAGRGPGVLTVYRWELTKLRYLKRTYLGLGAAVIVPILFVLAVHFRQHHGHGDFAFSSYLDRSGLAVPLVILLFGAVWMFPLITALVAGDIFASEDHNGTLKTIFTRSLERWQIFAGKALDGSDVRSGGDPAHRNRRGHRRLPAVRVQPAGEPVGDDRVRSEGARARLREHADLSDPDRDDRGDRSAAVGRHP